MKNKVYTQHHILTQDFGGLSRPNNLILLRESVHRGIHSVFASDTPIMRIRRLLETDKKVLNPDTYLAISDTLKKFEGIMEMECYEKDCIDYDKFYNRMIRD